MSTLLQFGESITSGSLGVEHFQPSTAISGELYISSSCISSNSSVQDSGGTCHKSVKTFNPHCTLLDGGFMASTAINILEDIPY